MADTPADIAARLKRYLPKWFGRTADPTPVLDSLLLGLGTALAGIRSLIAYAALQTRIATATGGWLELIAFDFFGADFPRFNAEPDADYSRRIRQETLRQRNTRAAIDSAVFDITGMHPHIFEGFHAPTNGGYGTPAFAFGRAGRWGSNTSPFHVIVTMPRPTGYTIPYRGGWGSQTGGYGSGNFSFVDDSSLQGHGATAADILAAINRVRAAGIRVIVRFTSPSGEPEAPP